MVFRDVLKFAGGSALGVLFTPAPWRLITDTALWSENWPGIPRPARGEIRAKFTNCSLCNAGCAVAEREGRFEAVQLQTGGAFDAGEGFDVFSGREGGSFLVPETNDHKSSVAKKTQYVKRNVQRAAESITTEARRSVDIKTNGYFLCAFPVNMASPSQRPAAAATTWGATTISDNQAAP